jgi:hypothetical protein
MSGLARAGAKSARRGGDSGYGASAVLGWCWGDSRDRTTWDQAWAALNDGLPWNAQPEKL